MVMESGHQIPGVSNRTFSNRTQSNSMVRLGSAIEHNRTHKETRQPEAIEHSGTELSELNRTTIERFCS